MMKKFLFSSALAAAVALVAWQWRGAAAPTAPAVAFTNLQGETVHTQDLRGKVVLVKFWATSCVTCVQQMPDTIAYQNTYGDRGFEVIGVAMQYDPPNYVKQFAQTRHLPFRVVIDAQGKIAQAFDQVRMTPTAFLIDKSGHIIRRYVGEYDKAAFVATLEQALSS